MCLFCSRNLFMCSFILCIDHALFIYVLRLSYMRIYYHMLFDKPLHHKICILWQCHQICRSPISCDYLFYPQRECECGCGFQNFLYLLFFDAMERSAAKINPSRLILTSHLTAVSAFFGACSHKFRNMTTHIKTFVN